VIRLIAPFLVVVLCAWVMLYGVKPAKRKEAWRGIRHALVAVSVGLGVLLLVFLTFSIIGVINV